MKEDWLHYLSEKCHKNIEITKALLFDAAFEGFFLNNEIDVEIEQEEISYSDGSSNWLDEYTENKETEMDSKTTNCSSIALLLEYKNLKMLFPGVQDENSCKFLLAAIFVYKPVINEYSKPVISNLQSE